jgi:methionyl-tRNA synthetase
MISEAKPWDLAKEASQRQTLNAVLYRAAEALRWLAVALYPVMPASASEIYQQLGLGDEVSQADPRSLRWGELEPGRQIKDVKPLFPRIDKAKTMEEIKQESVEQRSEVRGQRSDEQAAASNAEGDTKGSGQHATEADAVPGVAGYIDITPPQRQALLETLSNSKPIDSCSDVDVGEEAAHDSRGIAQPESLVGARSWWLPNLKPRKLRGYESAGDVTGCFNCAKRVSR